ncbi:unnamed protein product [Clonostachys rosea]|uniref:Aquaglyceroporin n=1 Tax=Bionectria ochroleuca TaxID=29856 RepID=A0ABY6TYY8_BIOOC|nr:unnamed protein product [Clonostachys rosea]
MSISHSQDSVGPSFIDKTVIPVDKIEHAGSMSQEESAHSVGYHSHEDEPAWTGIREYCQDFFSEFFGTCVMILFGDGVVAQVSLSEQKKGDYQSISWGWGLAVMLGVYCSSKSGGHLNPAVTFCNCLFRGHPWRKLPVYALGQLLGAMAGAFIVYGTYYQAIDNMEGPGVRTVGGTTSTAGIFCTYPASFLTRTQMWWSEIVSSTILMFVIFAMADPKNGNARKLMPLGLFFLIFGIGACFGWQTGYAINLARDFGPRLVSYIVGYGHDVWSAGGYYFWIPMVAPFFGTAFGAFLYDIFMYTGKDSPVNTPWWGFKRLLQPRRNVWSNTYKAKQISSV